MSARRSEPGKEQGGDLSRLVAESSGSTSLGRLPSIRGKRDLTLTSPAQTPVSAAKKEPKRTFAPTIPARRIKKEPSDGGERGGKELSRNRRGREVVTSASVFSMGPAERSMDRRRETASCDVSVSFARPGKGKPDVSGVADSRSFVGAGVEGESMDTSQPGEDRLDDLFADCPHPPIQLPLEYQLHKKSIAATSSYLAKVKQEPGATTDTLAKPSRQVVQPLGAAKHHQITANELFNPPPGSKGQFLFFQFPDCLPATKLATSSAPMEVTGATPTPAPPQQQQSDQSKAALSPSAQTCSLKDIPEGLVGKLRVHRSGKVKLHLGDIVLDVSMGTPCGFVQELVSIRTPQAPAQMKFLGHLSHRLVCTPDFQHLLSIGKR
ncbi:hypothetical protein EMCRGX_G024164 [Ephydatia muelleri]